MSLFTSFDYLIRTNNGGKHTDAPLLVRFTTDGVGKRLSGESVTRCVAERHVEKSYSWQGYPLGLAKQIANYYSAGNTQRRGYNRRFREYYFDSAQGWLYRTVYTGRSIVSVLPMGGGMYQVQITVDEVDQFLVDVTQIPTDYDHWCATMSLFYSGESWCHYDASSDTPYKFESYYDEPLTVRGS